MPEFNRTHFTVAQVFQTYLAFDGNLVRCSLALDMPKADIRALARAEQWDVHLKDWYHEILRKNREGRKRWKAAMQCLDKTSK